jgi:hypothetical protein
MSLYELVLRKALIMFNTVLIVYMRHHFTIYYKKKKNIVKKDNYTFTNIYFLHPTENYEKKASGLEI